MSQNAVAGVQVGKDEGVGIAERKVHCHVESRSFHNLRAGSIAVTSRAQYNIHVKSSCCNSEEYYKHVCKLQLIVGQKRMLYRYNRNPRNM